MMRYQKREEKKISPSRQINNRLSTIHDFPFLYSISRGQTTIDEDKR